MRPISLYAIARSGLLALCLLLLLPAVWAQKRVALVIGNSAYTVESRLANPVNDAQLIARTLTAQGFKVDVKTDLPKRAMELAIASFVRQSGGADSAVLYYAGHGAQPVNGGRNFLLPVDARVDGDDTLETDGIAADRIVEQMERSANPAKVRLVVLDACRNNRLAGKTRSGVRGLARMSPSDDYTLIAFSTNDQDVALDGNGANSPYAQALSKHLSQAGEIPLRRIFELTATDVRAVTQQKQKPRTYGDLDSRVLLSGSVVASIKPEPVQGPSAVQMELQAWTVAQRANSMAAYDAFLAEYPRGSYAAAARVALAGLKPAAPVMVDEPPVQPPEPRPATFSAGQVFRDCQEAHCPEMVVIPAGSFQMGSSEGDTDEKPVHQVRINRFAMGKYEVTQGQWKAVMGSNPSNFTNCGDNCPVEKVSWNDIQQYIQKLNQKTGQNYRLPSEAEWEYAARAGSAKNYAWGDDIGKNNANCNGCGSQWDNKTTAPVGSFKPNAFGMHDMHGNVWEWVQDWHHDNYSGAPTDGSAWESGGEQKARVLRGGSWLNTPAGLRSANRIWYTPDNRDVSTSFRLARTAP